MKNTLKWLWAVVLAAAIVFSACSVDSVNINTLVPVSGVSLDKNTLELTVGKTETLTATVAPANATNKNVSWSSSDTAIATVANGAVTAKAVGTATITVTTEDGSFTAQCTVTVNPAVAVTGVTLNENSLSLAVEDTATLTATVQPADATNKTVTWSSSDTGIATVSDGTITAVAVGTATITVTTEDGNKTATCSVTVTGGSDSITSETGIELVLIPAGTFMMGSPATEPNRVAERETQHSVTLTKSFYMSKYQVTQEQYQAVMGALPTLLTSGIDSGRGNSYPVYYVSWYDALVFCNKLSVMEGLEPIYSIGGSTDPEDWGSIPTSSNATWNAAVMDTSKNGYRLPTEAEWEYACRGDYPNKETETNTKPFGIGDGTKMISGMANFRGTYPYDLNHAPAGGYSDAGGTFLEKTTEVGSYEANNYGLYDMHGNLDEWCWDWYGTYETTDNTNPTGAVTGYSRVIRGGYWLNLGKDLRSACREYYYPSNHGFMGFRLVRSSL